ILDMTDTLIGFLQELNSGLSLKYNEFDIGLAKNGLTSNFVLCYPKKDWLRFEPRSQRSDEVRSRLDEAGVDVMDYDTDWSCYRIRLAKGDVQKHEKLLKDLLRLSYEESERRHTSTCDEAASRFNPRPAA